MVSDEKLTIHAENDEELERTIRVRDIDDGNIPIRTETFPNKPQATRNGSATKIFLRTMKQLTL